MTKAQQRAADQGAADCREMKYAPQEVEFLHRAWAFGGGRKELAAAYAAGYQAELLTKKVAA